MVELQFIDYESPEQAKQAVKQRAVKSQAARYHWARNAATRGSGSKRRSRAQVFDVVVVGAEEDTETCSSSTEHQNGDAGGNGVLLQNIYSLIDPLGAGRVDPFHSYPVAWQPYFPEVVDHYIVNMAVNICEIDGLNDVGLLRTRWFPLAMTEPATFLTVLLLASSHLCSVQRKQNVAIDLLKLKGQAIRMINEGLADPSRTYNDAMVGAVAKMCSYEAMYGTTDSYTIHMNGLQSMVSARGGLSQLGLDGLLRRICLWIDLNSAFLIKAPRFFQGSFFEEPNPAQFIGSWDVGPEDQDSASRSTSEESKKV